jgi:hypothetical protein
MRQGLQNMQQMRASLRRHIESPYPDKRRNSAQGSNGCASEKHRAIASRVGAHDERLADCM